MTTNVVSCREVVTDQQTGLLVPPRDSTALADALELLLEDSSLRHSLAGALRERVVSEFSRTKVHEAMTEVYEAALGRKLDHGWEKG